MEQLKKITQEEIAPTLHTGREDSPDLGTEGMQQLFDAHPSLNTNRQNENTDIQNRNNTVLEGHMNNTENPHQTTKAQVGLGSADNTSDMQKPVSTAQQAALNQKADKANTYTKTEVDVGLATKADRVNTYTKTEVDSKDTATLESAKTYANTGLATKANTIDVTKALEQKASMGYVNSGDLQALEQAKAYADKKVVDIGTGDMAQAVYDPRHKGVDVFGYVDRHTEDSSIHTEALTHDIRPFISTLGSDETGDGTQGNPYKTIQSVINKVPKNLNGFSAYLYIVNGIYNEDLVIDGFYGGTLTLYAFQLDLDVSVFSMNFNNCYGVFSHHVKVLNNIPNKINQVYAKDCHSVIFWGLMLEKEDKTKDGIYALRCDNVMLRNSKISGKARAIVSNQSTIYTQFLSGDNNNIGYSTGVEGVGGIIMRGVESTLTATTLIEERSGGKVW